jgi:hypothetical protein
MEVGDEQVVGGGGRYSLARTSRRGVRNGGYVPGYEGSWKHRLNTIARGVSTWYRDQAHRVAQADSAYNYWFNPKILG